MNWAIKRTTTTTVTDILPLPEQRYFYATPYPVPYTTTITAVIPPPVKRVTQVYHSPLMAEWKSPERISRDDQVIGYRYVRNSPRQRTRSHVRNEIEFTSKQQ
jgi:hypothetical protein